MKRNETNYLYIIGILLKYDHEWRARQLLVWHYFDLHCKAIAALFFIPYCCLIWGHFPIMIISTPCIMLPVKTVVALTESHRAVVIKWLISITDSFLIIDHVILIMDQVIKYWSFFNNIQYFSLFQIKSHHDYVKLVNNYPKIYTDY